MTFPLSSFMSPPQSGHPWPLRLQDISAPFCVFRGTDSNCIYLWIPLPLFYPFSPVDCGFCRVEDWSVLFTLRSWHQGKCLVHNMNGDCFAEWRILLASQKWGLPRRLGLLRKSRRTGSLWCASLKGYRLEMTARSMRVRRKCPIFLSFSVFLYGGAQLRLGWSRCRELDQPSCYIEELCGLGKVDLSLRERALQTWSHLLFPTASWGKGFYHHCHPYQWWNRLSKRVTHNPIPCRQDGGVGMLTHV